ncbi:MAG: NosD domain-containing protein [archaeon]
MRKQIFFISLFILASILSINAVKADEILGCVNITSPGVYVLNTSVTDWAGEGACINITSSDVEIDCLGGGNYVDGTNVINSIGIKEEGTSDNKLTNISIKNCNISEWDYGIEFEYTQNSTLSNITSNNNSNFGVYLYSSLNNSLSGISATNNSNTGIYLESSSHNNLLNINASDNTYGVYLVLSSNNTFYNINSSFNEYGTHLDSSSNNNISDVNSNNNSVYGFYLLSSSNNTFSSITSKLNYHGIYLNTSSNNNLDNINASENIYSGIYLGSSFNNTLSNINASENTLYGLYFYSSSNNNLSNITSSDNSDTGIRLYSNCSYNTLSSITSKSNNYGIQLSSNSSYNTITDINASGNMQYGIYLTTNHRNQIINSTIKDNKQYGLYLYYSSFNNITGTRIENNSVSQYSGIQIFSHASNANQNSSYNRFWNNIINNTPNGGSNWNLTGIHYTNYFNTTLTAGTNIVGKSWIGGNYWSDYTGSDTSGDYLGDSAYIINETYMNDSLPLTLTSNYTAPASSGDTGGGGGRSDATVYDAGTLQTSQEYELAPGEKIKFIMNDFSHTISLIGVLSKRAAVQIKTTTIVLTKYFEINVSQQIDVNNDGNADIEITVKNITTSSLTSKATIEVKSLAVAANSENPTPEGNAVSSQGTGNPAEQPPSQILTTPKKETLIKIDGKTIIRILLILGIALSLAAIIFLAIQISKDNPEED